jgi:hypothetical protein
MLKHCPEIALYVYKKGVALSTYSQGVTKPVRLAAHEHGKNITLVACLYSTGNIIPPIIIYEGIS